MFDFNACIKELNKYCCAIEHVGAKRIPFLQSRRDRIVEGFGQITTPSLVVMDSFRISGWTEIYPKLGQSRQKSNFMTRGSNKEESNVHQHSNQQDQTEDTKQEMSSLNRFEGGIETNTIRKTPDFVFTYLGGWYIILLLPFTCPCQEHWK